MRLERAEATKAGTPLQCLTSDRSPITWMSTTEGPSSTVDSLKGVHLGEKIQVVDDHLARVRYSPNPLNRCVCVCAKHTGAATVKPIWKSLWGAYPNE